MIPFKELIVINKKADTSVYMQIANAVILAIRQGRLRKELKLPGSRELAVLLGVHRKTMVAAYDELMVQGWIEVVPRKGTFVVRDLPEVKPLKIRQEPQATRYPSKTIFAVEDRSAITFPATELRDAGSLVINDGFPDIRLAPIELFIRELRSLARQRGFRKYYGYGSPAGPAYLRETLCNFLRDTRALPIGPENILVTRGAQMGIFLASHLLLRPGDNVVVGEPGYFGANRTFQRLGATLNRVPVDDQGLRVDAVESLCKKKKIKLLYVIPHHHHPTTVTLTPERRMRLLELAARYRFAVIEDDYDYDFHYTSNPVLPMASLDHHGNIIYIGTLTKTLAPAFRIGFMVAPENFIQAVAQLRRSVDWQGDSMMEVAVAELYRNGAMARHIRKSVKLYRERRDHFCELLKEQLGNAVEFRVPDGGMSVWTCFHGTDLHEVAAKAARKGLFMSDGSLYNSPTIRYNATRLGFASLNLKEQNRAIDILSQCIH